MICGGDGNISEKQTVPSYSKKIPSAKDVYDVPNTPKQYCPVCKSEVRLFFINFNEKMLMCENTQCEYPFGYEELQFFRHDDNIDNTEEVASISIKNENKSPSITHSVVSAAGWSDIEKMNRIFDSEDSQQESGLHDINLIEYSSNNVNVHKKEQSQILENVKQIAELSNEMNGSEQPKFIKNKKWIKKLINLQETAKVKLVNPHELYLINKIKEENESTNNMENFSVEVLPGEGTLSSIKIEVGNRIKQNS